MRKAGTINGKPCAYCGAEEYEIDWNEEALERMRRYGACEACEGWAYRLEHKNNSRYVRVNGSHYKIGDGRGFFRGYGGRAFLIQFHDGRKVECRDLWHQGPIPEHFRAQLPDNAVFLDYEAATLTVHLP